MGSSEMEPNRSRELLEEKAFYEAKLRTSRESALAFLTYCSTFASAVAEGVQFHIPETVGFVVLTGGIFLAGKYNLYAEIKQQRKEMGLD